MDNISVKMDYLSIKNRNLTKRYYIFHIITIFAKSIIYYQY